MPTLNKTALVELVSTKSKVESSVGYHKYEVKEILEHFLEVIRDNLIEGTDIDLEGVLKTTTKPTKARRIWDANHSKYVEYPASMKTSVQLHVSLKNKIKQRLKEKQKENSDRIKASQLSLELE